MACAESLAERRDDRERRSARRAIRGQQKAIELAWLWVRHQPGSALQQWFCDRTADASQRVKRISIVALARKLIVALWRYLRTGLDPEGALITG